MKPLHRRIMSLPLLARGVIVTLLAFLISWIAVYDLTSVSFFSPMEKAADFRFSDFYTLVANDRAVKTLHPSVVIVAVDGCNRREIAAAINDIDYCMPAAVGLDIAFSTPRDTIDDPLSEAIASCAGLVLPVVAEENSDGSNYSVGHCSYYDRFASALTQFAAVNIEGEREARFTVRDFMPVFKSSAGNDIPSLSYALAVKANPAVAERLEGKCGKSLPLHYASREFDIIYPEEILDNPEAIEGKIVIIGKINDAVDLHTTPLDNFTPGVIIQAYSTATLLDGSFTRRLTTFESWLIALIACYAVVMLSLHLAQHTLGDLIVRGLQLLSLYLMIVGGTLLYTRFDIDLDFTNAMLMTSLGVVACDIFNGIFDENGIIDICRDKIAPRIIHFKNITHELYKKLFLKSAADTSVDNDGGVTRS